MLAPPGPSEDGEGGGERACRTRGELVAAITPVCISHPLKKPLGSYGVFEAVQSIRQHSKVAARSKVLSAWRGVGRGVR